MKDKRLAMYEFYKAMQEFTDGAYKLRRMWEQCQDTIPNFEEMISDFDYPFHKSFDELTEDLAQYTENMEQLYKEEF